MPGREYDRMRAVEDEHWWYRALRSLVARELARAARGRGPQRLLDVGCGTGRGLARWSEVLGRPSYGIDLSPDALAHCRARGERLLAQASAGALPFGAAAFDLVVSLDVLCLDGVDEARALAEIHRVLRPGGRLVLNLPAFEALRGEHDRAVRIRHRSTTAEVAALLRSAGFGEVRASYWNTALFPAVWLTRRLRHGDAEPTSDLALLPRPVNALLAALVQAEGRLLARVAPPFGTSVLSVAVKL